MANLFAPHVAVLFLELVSAYTARAVTSTSKAGLAWPNGDYENIQQFESSKVSWYYTWSPHCIDIADNLECVPMLWGTQQETDFNGTIQSTIDSHNVKAVLGVNEPNEQGQSNLSPEDAANLWKQCLEPLRTEKNVRLGSPAPSSNPNGVTWMQDFLNACNGGCTVDFIAIHYYDVNATDFQRYVQQYHTTFNLPIWVTEWACQNFNNGPQCSPEDIQQFMSQTQSFMDATDYVERYAWFGAFKDLQGVNPEDALMDTQGRITELGRQYVGSGQNGSAAGGEVGSGSHAVLRGNFPIYLVAAILTAILVVV
ncbi:glycosyl hydrolase catalytic core-domain-containing protein [Irpex lacteus]|nr:glycosyl hydrolase catalytic core-domain-containing protein [Irpex lacteus]